ncbi:biotin transporter BioY [Viridibacillus sp. YIM B01967]|uniref:Biotin transporter n=1 Tax=Viridibacillus soli TaxID=2798301 RepID=A0ABS1H433_9BACL|nr:biotin transporter BioY [Viridibacillus soli]MBK3494180.1 biotin transporter BioY [Viridibacillus soli]
MTTARVKTKSKMRTVDIVYCGMFATLMMIGANITAFAPFLVIGGVPITLQTFFAILAGLILGSRLGAISVLVYACIGLAGAPVFARFGGGFGQILSPTFGFIIGFIISAYIAGKIVERYSSIKGYITASIMATIIGYIIGTNWMYVAYKLWANAPDALTYKLVWLWMVPPFPKDIILGILAGMFGHRMYKILKIRRD